MSKINTLPKGLQQFLGNTHQGVNPSELSQTVQPQVDLQPFWSADKLKWFSNAVTVTTPGNGNIVVVPQGELWSPVVHSGRITGLTPADTVAISTEIWAPDSTRFITSSVPTQTAITTNDTFSSQWVPDRDVWYPGGYKFVSITFELSIASPSETLTHSLIYKLARA